MLDQEDSDDENDFYLLAPDRYQERHLFTKVKFAIGGKKPLFYACDLSRKHQAKDVIKHLLTLYRKDKDMREAVNFKNAFGD